MSGFSITGGVSNEGLWEAAGAVKDAKDKLDKVKQYEKDYEEIKEKCGAHGNTTNSSAARPEDFTCAGAVIGAVVREVTEHSPLNYASEDIEESINNLGEAASKRGDILSNPASVELTDAIEKGKLKDGTTPRRYNTEFDEKDNSATYPSPPSPSGKPINSTITSRGAHSSVRGGNTNNDILPYNLGKLQGLPDHIVVYDLGFTRFGIIRPIRLDGKDEGLDLSGPYNKAVTWFSDNWQTVADVALGNWFKLFRDMLIMQNDPLTLDLDGDGIETVASNGHKGALFDHSNDGIRTATGWVSKDDGLLVYDRNGDGVVNNGSELFGDNTPLKNGKRAANGYQALAELDDNGDGKVDAADSAFAKLRVWRDLNQDGISQEGELFTLEEAKVKALNLANKNADRDLGNGNTLAEEGTYTDSDGNEKQMGDINLAADPFHSRFSDSVTLTDEQQQTPNLRGSGRVRDLREAAAQSPDVAAALQAYANAQTKEEQLALRDQLLRAWAGTDKRFTTEGVLEAASAKTFTMTNKGNAIPLTPGELKALGTIEGPDVWTLLGIEDPEKKKKAALREKIAILDAFTGTDSTHLYYGTKAQAQHTLDTIEKTYANLADNLYDGLLFQTRLKPYLNAIRFGMNEDGKLQLDYSGVAALFDEVHAKNPGKAFTDLGELLAKGNADGNNTDLAPLAEKFVQYVQEASNNGTFEAYSNSLGKESLAALGHSLGTDNDDTLRGNHGANYLVGNKGNDSLYGYEGKDILDGGKGDDYMEGGDFGSDTYLFQAGHGKDFVAEIARGDEDADTLRFAGAKAGDVHFSREDQNLVINAYGNTDRVTLRRYFYNDDYRHFHFQFDDKTLEMADIAKHAFTFAGTAGGDSLYGWVSNDTIHGGDGDDRISGYAGDDTLHGDAGNDSLRGGDGNDRLEGGTGDDTLEGEAGNDSLAGGEGDDHLYGGEGKDTLDGGRGDDYLEGGDFGSDTYVFQAGHGKDLVAEIARGDEDADILRFAGAKAGDVHFSREGSNLVINAYGNTDRVTLRRYFYNDDYRHFHFQFDDKTLEAVDVAKNTFTVTGTDANDSINGWITNDTIQGGAGDDYLAGDGGDDHLDGGTGNDTLRGGSGNDDLAGGEGDDSLRGDEGNDSLDGGTGADTLEGGAGNDSLAGGEGNDQLYGGEGKDTLDGGRGDDYMEGGDYGSDTYVFQAGHGKDLVAEIARKDEEADTLRFEGAKAADARFSRDGYNLVVNAYGDSNQVTLRRYFYNDDYRHFHFQFDDKALEMADIAKQVFAFNGTDSNDRLYGWITNDAIHGGDGDDSIYGYAGDDTLHGDAGNDLLNGDEGNDYLDGGTGDDTLKGGSGDDVLEGSEGNDSLYGNEGKDTLNGGSGDDYLEGGDYGSDTYVFQAGHGKDLVAEIARKDEEADTLRFEGAKAADARFSRDGYNLVVNAYGDSNQVTLRRYFYNDDYRHFHFQFDDAVFKATELRDIDLPTQGLKAPADATQAANMQTQTAAPAAENVQPEADAQKQIVAVDRARPAPQKVISETALNTLQANADADVASDNSTAAADAVGNTVKNAATVAKPATVLAPAATSKKIWPATTIATDTQQASAATASVSGELSATAPQRTSLVTVQQNAIAAANALKTGSTTVTPATTLDAKAAQQSQQMLSAMAAHNQTATPTELAAPDLQPKPQLVANPV